MKKLFLFTSLILFCCIDIYSQSNDDASGAYEFAISFDSKTIIVKVRNTASTIRVRDSNPIVNSHFAGLGFALKWSAKSTITLYQLNSKSPFDIKANGDILEIKNNHIQVYKDEAKQMPIFPQELMNGEWHIMASIPYSGTFADGDKIELVAYNFNENTNAYFNVHDNSGNFIQYAPRLINDLNYHGCAFPVYRTVIVYQDSTKNNLFVVVTSTKPTKATFKIYNMKGITIKTEEHELNEGLNEIKIDISDLEKVRHLIKVIDGKALNYTDLFNKE